MFETDLDTYWKTVVNTMRDGIMIVDTTGSIISVNRALETITGYSREELIGQKCSILNCSIYKMAREQGEPFWCKLFKNGSLDVSGCTIMNKSGAYIQVLKNASQLRDRKGNVIGAVETVTDITEIVEKDKQIAAFRRKLKSEDGFHEIIGISAAMRSVYDLIENAALSDAPVIILGESGTGKELVARAIHQIGGRKSAPFVKVNCAALTETLLESELFGHVKGAYTGAYKDRAGRFEMAQSGDIFLDEIGDLPLITQVKLLRVLEDKIIERVGDSKPIPVDVRIISATNRCLPSLIEKGSFREDLFFRINVIPIHLPPLRERLEDIPLLAESIFRKIQMKSGKDIKGISKDLIDCLINYTWPGNVRELKSAFEYAVVVCQEPMIRAHHLPPGILQEKTAIRHGKPLAQSKEEIKKRELISALNRSKGNQSLAAEMLGISRVTIWNRMRKYGIRSVYKTDVITENHNADKTT
ncbi:MAG: sigma-54 interaction domain-containing protein [Syntrophobacteraceae bacterium]